MDLVRVVHLITMELIALIYVLVVMDIVLLGSKEMDLVRVVHPVTMELIALIYVTVVMECVVVTEHAIAILLFMEIIVNINVLTQSVI